MMKSLGVNQKVATELTQHQTLKTAAHTGVTNVAVQLLGNEEGCPMSDPLRANCTGSNNLSRYFRRAKC